MDLFTKPAGVGVILDRSFQLYRKHFKTAYLLMIIFFGPIYFLQNLIIFGASEMSFLPQSGDTVTGSLDEIYSNSEMYSDTFSIVYLLFTFLVLPIYVVAIMPAAISSLLHLVRTKAEGREVRLGELLKRSFSPYWRMTGYTMLFGLILFGVYIALVVALTIIIFVFFLLFAALGAGLTELGSDPFGGGVALVVMIIILYLLFIVGVMASYGFFVIRFGFYLPIIALDNGEQPIARSWRLTKGNFWRIFAISMVLSLVSTVFMLGGYALAIAVFKLSILGQIIQVLFALLILPVIVISYGVIFYDLRGRNEGADLEHMLKLANEADDAKASARTNHEPLGEM